MPPAENKKAVEQMLQAFNTGDFKIVDQLLATEFSDDTPFPGTTKQNDGLKKQISHLRQAFPDVKFTIESMVAEGETVAFRWKMVGTQEKTFIGQPASRKTVTHFGNDFVNFHNGKMISHKSTDNLRDLMVALGHEPVFKVDADPHLKAPLK